MTEANIERIQTDINYWQDYKDNGCQQHQLQIALLEQEMKEIEQIFNEIDGKESLIKIVFRCYNFLKSICAFLIVVL